MSKGFWSVGEGRATSKAGKKSISRVFLILTFSIIYGFWLRSLLRGEILEVPASLMQTLWTFTGYEGFKRWNPNKTKEEQGDNLDK